MADTTPTPPAADLAVLLNVVAEQTRMIQLLQERVGALEGQTPSPRASAVASPVSPPNDTSTILTETSDEDVESPNTSVEPENSERALSDDSVIRQVEGTTEEHPASATPTVPDQAREASPGDVLAPPSTASQPSSLRPEAQAFSPSFPPPSGDPSGPHPGNSVQPTSCGVPADGPAATGHAQDSLSPVHDDPTDTNNHTQTDDELGTLPVEDSTATAMNEWAPVISDHWGEPMGDTVQAPSGSSVDAESIESPKDTRRLKLKGIVCRSDGQCTRSDCWFGHPSQDRQGVRRNARSSSAHSSTSKSSTGNANPGPGKPSKQAGGGGKPACRDGEICSRKNCYFTHPPGWNAPKSRAKPVSDQQTFTCGGRSDGNNWVTPSDNNVHATANNTWDTECQDDTTVEANNNWGTWDVVPNNDWATPVNNDWATPANNDWANPTNESKPPTTATPVAEPQTPVLKQKKPPKSKQRETERQRPRNGRERGRSAASKESTTSSVRSSSAQPIPVTQLETGDDSCSITNGPAAPTDIANSADATSIDAISVDATSVDTTSIDATPVEAPLPADLLLDVLGTPNLEPASSPTTSSSLSELDVPATPFSWADEPLDDAISPSQPNKNQANLDQVSPRQLNKNQANLDKTAPSCMYSSWAQSETSDWGDTIADPTDDTNNTGIDAAPTPAGQKTQTEGPSRKQGAKDKGKGKQKETGQGKPTAVSSPKKKDSSTRIPGPSNASTSTTAQQVAQTSKPEPTPVHRPEPQGVPDADVASWLLGEGEDDHAVLGLSPNPTPKPVTIPVRPPSPRPGPSQPRLNKTPGEHFPPLAPSSNYKPPATSVASGPTIRPMQTGFKIISIGGTPTAHATKASNKGPVLNSKSFPAKKQTLKASK